MLQSTYKLRIPVFLIMNDFGGASRVLATMVGIGSVGNKVL